MTDPQAVEPADNGYGVATEQRVLEIVEAAQKYGRRSIIGLSGVPGTGKSYTARIAAQRLAGDPLRVRELQFHPSTSYEEFVEGMRLDSSGAISVVPGLFLEWNDLAHDSPNLTWVVLIDELTRANISAVMGELMTFIEDRDRPFTTTYSRRPVNVAPNLIVLCTFNPTDRSALDIDNALLRRLRIIRCPPDEGQLHDLLQRSNLTGAVVEKLQSLFVDLRTSHPAEFDDLMPFGHAIFAEVVHERPDLNELWEERMRHILRRPLIDPHPFYEEIVASFPWVDPAYALSE